MLSTVVVEAPADEELKTKLYSALYLSYKAPTTFSEHGGVYMGMDGLVHTLGEVASDKRGAAYTDMSLWDVHRTQFPWLSLAMPDVFTDIIASLQEMARVGGDLPRWPLANVYTECMIGSHGMVSLAEAVVKGQADKLNLTFVYELMRATGTTTRPHAGRPYIVDYLKYGVSTVPYL